MFRMGDRVSFEHNGNHEGVIVDVEEYNDMAVVFSRELNGWNLSREESIARKAIELGLLTQEETKGYWFWAFYVEDLTLVKRRGTIEWVE